MITLVFEHRGCDHEGEQVPVRPAVDGNSYAYVTPRCADTHLELVLVSTEG